MVWSPVGLETDRGSVESLVAVWRGSYGLVEDSVLRCFKVDRGISGSLSSWFEVCLEFFWLLIFQCAF